MKNAVSNQVRCEFIDEIIAKHLTYTDCICF